MYKFEISADSPAELREKMREFADEILIDENRVVPQYADEPMDTNLPNVPSATASFPTAPNALHAPTSQPVAPTPDQGPRIPTARIGLDSRNIPWDERVHASTKEITADGSWRKSRGVSKELVKQIEEELKAETTVRQTVTIVPPVPAAPPISGLPNFAPQTVAPVPSLFGTPPAILQPAPVVQAAPIVQAPPVVEQPKYEQVQVPQGTRPAHSLVTFKNNLMEIIGQLYAEGKIDKAYITQLNEHYAKKNKERGLPPHKDIWNLIGVESNCMELYDAFAEYGFITKVD